MKKSAFYFFMILSIFSCKDQGDSTNPVEKIETKEAGSELQEPETNAAHSSRESLGWVGIYSGVLPCEDCSGIDTSIALNKDLGYLLKVRYLGSPELESQEIISEGKFSWDKNGIDITLEEANISLRRFKVGENFLMPLDKNAKAMEGVPGNNYKLYK